jgi:hypothetical protein
MWIKKIKTKEQRLREYDRAMLRSAFVSLFWVAISDRKRRGKYTLQMLADKLGTNKSGVSRWFSKDPPNWGIDTISDVASALELDMDLRATDRVTGTVFTSSGIATPVQVSTTPRRSTIIKESSRNSSATETEQMTFGPLRFTRTPGGTVPQLSRLSVAAQ